MAPIVGVSSRTSRCDTGFVETHLLELWLEHLDQQDCVTGTGVMEQQVAAISRPRATHLITTGPSRRPAKGAKTNILAGGRQLVPSVSPSPRATVQSRRMTGSLLARTL